jgi:hypothetical protein
MRSTTPFHPVLAPRVQTLEGRQLVGAWRHVIALAQMYWWCIFMCKKLVFLAELAPESPFPVQGPGSPAALEKCAT